MRSVISTITTKGQITLPAEIRRLLGVGTHDKVAFVIDDDQVCLQPVAYTLQSAYGSVEPTTHPEDFDGPIQTAKEERAKQTTAKLKAA